MAIIETAEDILSRRNREKIAAGMVEQKFFLRGVAEATLEEIYADINSLDEAFERGNYVELVSTSPEPG